jgi:hypothetical protein
VNSTLTRKTPLKRSPIKRKSAKRKTTPKLCDWSNRCKRRAPVIVSETERYCRSHAREMADRAAREFVLKRDWWTCQNCSSGAPGLQWAHVISRGARYIRHEPNNAMALCGKCHLNFTLKPALWSVWLATNRPGLHDRMALLEAAGQRSGHTIDLAQVIRDYREGKVAA